METEPAASSDSTPPESTADEPVPAVPTKETTPIWAQTNPAAPAHKKGDPDWSKTVPPANGGASKPAREWAATVPSSPGEPAEIHEPEAKNESTEKAVSTEPPPIAAITDPPKAVAADAMKSTWPPVSASSPAPPEETDIWPPEPPTERAMPAWPPPSEIEEPETPAQAIPSWPESFDAAPAAPAAAPTPPTITPEPKPAPPAAAPTAPPPTVQPIAAAAEPPAPAVASTPPARTVPLKPVEPAAPEPPPTAVPAPQAAPAPEQPPVRPSQSAPPARPAWAPAPSAEPVTPVAKTPSAPQLQVPAWAPRVPLASQPGTPTWFSPKEEIPHATAQPIAQPIPTPEPEPAEPIVGGQLPVAQIPVAPQPAGQQPAKVSTWEVVEQPRKSGPHAAAQAGPTAEDRSYAEWFAWAKRGGAPATACHAAAQGAFKALSSGKDVNTAVQWATAAMSRPPEPVAYARQQYCAWFALANIDLNLDQHRAHLFSAAAIQALDAGQDASAAHAAGLAAAGIR